MWIPTPNFSRKTSDSLLIALTLHACFASVDRDLKGALRLEWLMFKKKRFLNSESDSEYGFRLHNLFTLKHLERLVSLDKYKPMGGM